ncbi:MAG: hypothetical protein IPL65_21200 [Lewinellaceae bacterium]|nr:hypothetical protein [Lewinellaceae bacterium]
MAPSFHLKFSLHDQYEINLTSNYYRPYALINSKHLKRLGDKLLYSSAFLMDHILKFHKTAFSWRNLEMLPDVILANKDPNFRQYFQDIMHFMSAQYVRETLNAVFQFKFYSEVKNEMEYLSKISEFSSAAFNFTLDESYHLKNYYKKKLAAKYQEYQHNSDGRETMYINSIGYLHSILGDLHYYDEEYDDAIIHYTDSSQAIRNALEEKKVVLSHKVMLYCINQLNLGHSLERTRAYNRAYSVYRTLILTTSSLNPANFGAGEEETWESPYKRMQLFMKPHVALLGVIEKQRIDGITYDNLERNIYEYAKFLKIQDLQLFPSSKNNIVTYSQIRYSQNQKGTDKKRIVSMITDYYVSVGSILFFKNQVFYGLLYRHENLKQESITKKVIHYYEAHKANGEASKYRPSHAAYLYYLHALCSFNTPYVENYIAVQGQNRPEGGPRIIFGDLLERDLVNQLHFILFYLDESVYPILNAKQCETLANILSKLSDALLACVNEAPRHFDILKIANVQCYKDQQNDYKKDLEAILQKIGTTENITIDLPVVVARLSHDFYKKAGNIYSASFQLKKILFIFRNVVKNVKDNMGAFETRHQVIEAELQKKSTKGKALDALKLEQEKCQKRIKTYYIKNLKQIGEYLFNNLVLISMGSNRAQITKYRERLDDMNANQKKYTNEIYLGVSTAPEVKEIISIIEFIKLKLEDKPNAKSISQIGTFNTISSMYARVLELKLKSEYNLKNMKEIKLNQNMKSVDYNQALCFAVDGLFANYELIRILNTYGINYILTHSYKGSVHYSMAKFCEYFETLQQAYKSESGQLNPDQLLGTFIGKDFKLEIDKYYHFELAALHMQKAKELHCEGQVYKSISREMYVLDDDFNDNLTHFCAASERLRINLGIVDAVKQNATAKIKDSNLFKYDSYVTE